VAARIKVDMVAADKTGITKIIATIVGGAGAAEEEEVVIAVMVVVVVVVVVVARILTRVVAVAAVAVAVSKVNGQWAPNWELMANPCCTRVT
jgi:hypothetical protein